MTFEHLIGIIGRLDVAPCTLALYYRNNRYVMCKNTSEREYFLKMNNKIFRQNSKIITRMTTCLFLCLLFLLSCTIMTNCTAKEESMQKQMNYEFYYLADYWNAYDLSHSALPTQESFEALVTQYIPEIEALLGLFSL